MSSDCPFTVNTDCAISEMKEAGYEVYVLAAPKHGGLGAVLLWWLLKMKNGGIFWPDIYMHGECHKVQEKHFKNRF